MTMTLEPASEVKIMIEKIRCTAYFKGRKCDHVIATVNVDEKEEQRKLQTTVECKRCGNVERLSRFM